MCQRRPAYVYCVPRVRQVKTVSHDAGQVTRLLHTVRALVSNRSLYFEPKPYVSDAKCLALETFILFYFSADFYLYYFDQNPQLIIFTRVVCMMAYLVDKQTLDGRLCHTYKRLPVHWNGCMSQRQYLLSSRSVFPLVSSVSH